METTFITIHDLSPEAHLLYSSDSIIDILGYTPDEVVNRPCWDFFHPDELPFARKIHNRGVKLDKAASLSYCRLRSRDGQWVCCECVFTIVYDVMVGCISIYRKGPRSQKRAFEAPIIRRLFSSSPRDPRYHMLSHLSPKFLRSPKVDMHEPRAALFLNRFTRTLTIMYATNALQDLLGICSEDLKGRSFYYLIQENCLEDAVKCLENAKANHSIAYLRFWYRNPRQDDEPQSDTFDSQDEEMLDFQSSEEDESEGGVHLSDRSAPRGNAAHMVDGQPSDSENSERRRRAPFLTGIDVDSGAQGPMRADDNSIFKNNGHNNGEDTFSPNFNSNSRASSGESTSVDTHEDIFGQPKGDQSSASSFSPQQSDTPSRASLGSPVEGPIELEAVISCSSDGLVVCMRRARPVTLYPGHGPAQPVYANGLFASPWAQTPIVPPPQERPQFAYDAGFAPSLAPVQPVRSNVARGPPPEDFMNSIRDIAVFAWGLTGINGTLADYSTGPGRPMGDSVPGDGCPIWTGGKDMYDVHVSNSYGTSDGPGITDNYAMDSFRQPRPPMHEHSNSLNNGSGHVLAGCSFDRPRTNGGTFYDDSPVNGSNAHEQLPIYASGPFGDPPMADRVGVAQGVKPIQTMVSTTAPSNDGGTPFHWS